MSNSQPKISIVIPLYNKAQYVVEALESVFSQSLPAHEIIVVDDGSTDDGVVRVQSLAHTAIRLIQQPNAGVSVARNAGIRAATGDVIAFLDADDRYLPGFLAAIVRLAQDCPEASLIGTGYQRFSSHGRVANNASDNKPQRGLVDDFYTWWCRSSFVFTSSLAVRAAVFRESGIQFPPGERLGEDQDVWFQMAERCAIAFDPAVHCEYRVDVAGSATHAPQIVDPLPCYARLAGRLNSNAVPAPLVPGAQRLLASHYLNVARSRLLSGDAKGALQLVLNPVARANPVYLLRTFMFVSLATLKRRVFA